MGPCPSQVSCNDGCKEIWSIWSTHGACSNKSPLQGSQWCHTKTFMNEIALCTVHTQSQVVKLVGQQTTTIGVIECTCVCHPILISRRTHLLHQMKKRGSSIQVLSQPLPVINSYACKCVCNALRRCNRRGRSTAAASVRQSACQGKLGRHCVLPSPPHSPVCTHLPAAHVQFLYHHVI